MKFKNLDSDLVKIFLIGKVVISYHTIPKKHLIVAHSTRKNFLILINKLDRKLVRWLKIITISPLGLLDYTQDSLESNRMQFLIIES
ncbi:hypothetical protein BpHYR1_049032 [Brachionus plicatilis]|uniref:Uncharacterized protein n=1 Tax=Brachionus plicatilis TaxID=10195 RepID=A0A3M7S6K7_BRAPC|nr:hypothetical protein BpHYR1_049032 [Brachionus plicatilis]